jgi:DNA-binding NarL/FixJ family response regulator
MSRILIADGSDIVRKMLKLLLESGTGWTVCGEAIDGNEAVLKARELNPTGWNLLKTIEAAVARSDKSMH